MFSSSFRHLDRLLGIIIKKRNRRKELVFSVAESFFIRRTEFTQHFLERITLCATVVVFMAFRISFRFVENWSLYKAESTEVPHVPQHRNVVTRSANFSSLLTANSFQWMCSLSSSSSFSFVISFACQSAFCSFFILLVFYRIISQNHISTMAIHI